MKGVGLLAWACPTCPNGTLVGQVSLDHPFSGHLLPAKFTCAIRALRVASRGVRGCPSVPWDTGQRIAARPSGRRRLRGLSSVPACHGNSSSISWIVDRPQGRRAQAGFGQSFVPLYKPQSESIDTDLTRRDKVAT